MGRIKSTLIKRTARILEKEEYFADDFERNKKILGLTMPSKSVRNKIAGYISRIKQNRKKDSTRAPKPVITAYSKNSGQKNGRNRRYEQE